MRNLRNSTVFGIGCTIWLLMIIFKCITCFVDGMEVLYWDDLWFYIPVVMVILGGLPKQQKIEQKEEPKDNVK